jgi:predicted RNA-binding Zn ribbon-like protein
MLMVSMKRGVGAGQQGRVDARNGEVIAGLRADLCLDFANTLAWRGSTPAEQIHDFAELLDWCAGAGCLSEAAARRARAWSWKHPEAAAATLNDAIDLREAIYRILPHDAGANGATSDDLVRLNRALTEAPPRVALGRVGDRMGWRVARDGTAAAGLLAPVLWSAADLLAGQNLKRVRRCANGACLWLFFDDSKGGTRRWCSMQACGNRAKARRHYLRRKA